MPILPDSVIGNTPDFDSGKSRFEPWSGNVEIPVGGIFLLTVKSCEDDLAINNITTQEQWL